MSLKREDGRTGTLVSVIMPTYNRGYVIQDAIDSVRAQIFTGWELLIVDDGSVDGTEKIVAQNTDKRIRYIKLFRNYGACYARNRGLECAKGRYIAFLDTDNIWSKEYLDRRLNALKHYGESIGGVFGYTSLIKDGVKITSVPSSEYEKNLCENHINEFLIKKMLCENLIDTNTIVLKKECAKKIEGFDESLQRLQDWDFFFRILVYSGYEIKFSNDYLVTNYLKEDSISRKNNENEYWKSRIKFLRQYKGLYEKYHLLSDAVCQMCLMLDPYADHDVLRKVMGLLTNDELQEVMLHMRDRFEANEKWRMDIEKWRADIEKLYLYYLDIHEKENMILRAQEKWLSVMQRDVSILNDLKEKYIHIAIYGYGFLGRTLKREIEKQKLVLSCIIDKNKKGEMVDGVPIVSPVEMPSNTELVIVTAIRNFEEIREEYEDNVPFMSLNDLIENAFCYLQDVKN